MDKAQIEKAVREMIDERSGEKPTSTQHKCCGCKKMTIELAKRLCDKVTELAKSRNLKVVVAVANAGARPVCVNCMDDAYIASYDIALNKAFTSASLKMSTSKLSELASPGGDLYGIQNTNGGKIVIFGGGEPLSIKGKFVGAIGISGATLAEDTQLGEDAVRMWEEILCR